MLAALSLGAVAAGAATFNVNSTADANDIAPGDGVCAVVGGQCTLRAAIQEANALAGPDTASVPAGTYTLSDALGQLVVTSNVTVSGAGSSATIVRQPLGGRILQVEAGGRLDLRDATVRDATVADDGAGIRSFGVLILRRVAVFNNQAIGSSGGGIYATGPLAVIGSLIGSPNPALGNKASQEGGEGGGIYAAEGLVLRDSLVIGNRHTGPGALGSSQAAGIATFGTTTIERSWVHGNGDENTRFGGGIGTVGPFSKGPLRITDSTLSGNTALQAGAAVNANGAALVLENTTVSGNHIIGNDTRGSAILLDADPGVSATLVARHVTVASNTLVSQFSAAIILQSNDAAAATARLRATIVDGGPDHDSCRANSFGGTNAVFISDGFNVERGNSYNLVKPTDRPNSNPQLGPLGFNGGPGLTQLPAPASPAVDLVTAGCPPPATDERGLPRPQGPGCDAGAVEIDTVAPDLRILGGRLALTRRGAIRIELACPATEPSGPCTGTAKLRTRKLVRFRGKKRRVVLGKAPFSIASDESGKAKVEPSAAKRRLVERLSPLKVKAIVSVDDALGNSGKVSKQMRLRARG